MKTIKVRPVLLPTNYINATLTLYHDGKGKYPKLSTDLNKLQYHTNQQLILISLEDEKIEVGNKYYDEHNNLVLTATTQSDHNIYHYKKIVATQEQLSPELINQLITDYNNGGMQDLEIEMVEITEPVQDGHWNKYTQSLPKITNGFVTIVEKKPDNFISFLKERIDKAFFIETKAAYTIVLEQYKKEILYNEEEVKRLYDLAKTIIYSLSSIISSNELKNLSLEIAEFENWFNQNKKK